MGRILGLVLIAACSYAPERIGPGGDDQPVSDSSVDPDANVGTEGNPCFGTSLVRVCPNTPPNAPVTLAVPIDTDNDNDCTQVVPQNGGSSLCAIIGTTVDVTADVVATGSRPLVLVGATAVTVTGTGTVNVSSNATRTGAGANFAAICDQPMFVAGNPEGDSGGGGGGAGGGFGTVGGSGGLGDDNDNHLPTPHKGIAGVAGVQQPLPEVLRGGCAGGSGGGGTEVITELGPAGGASGGAVYLIAGTQMTITGRVFASGGGGRVNSGSAGFEQGGGGGGSGGMIGIDAPSITIDGIVAANGGGGGGGGGTVGGTAGAPGTTTAFNTRAANGVGDAPGSGGNGAAGTCVGAVSQATPPTVDAGGGGGGGGVGVVWIDGAVTNGTKVSPAPTPH